MYDAQKLVCERHKLPGRIADNWSFVVFGSRGRCSYAAMGERRFVGEVNATW